MKSPLVQVALGAAVALVLSASASAAIIEEVVEYGDAAGNKFEGFLAYDDAAEGPRPGVIIVHQWTGISDYEKARARMLAELGYVAFAADIYGKGVRPQPPESGKIASLYRGNRPLFRERLTLGLEQLRTHTLTNDDQLLAVGYCFGGTGVLELARTGADVKAVVSFHGSLANPNPDDDANIKTKLLICHGTADPVVPWSDVTAMVESFEKHGLDYQLSSYGSGVFHSFTHIGAKDYDEKADKRSWSEMQNLFKEALDEAK